MNFLAKVVPVLLLTPMIALGAGELTEIDAFIDNIVRFMNGTLVPFVFAILLVS
jgi:hypothetical protein